MKIDIDILLEIKDTYIHKEAELASTDVVEAKPLKKPSKKVEATPIHKEAKLVSTDVVKAKPSKKEKALTPKFLRSKFKSLYAFLIYFSSETVCQEYLVKNERVLKIKSIFEDGKRISLQQWFCAMYLHISYPPTKGISPSQLGVYIGVKEDTASIMLYRIKKKTRI